jgi:hypothetical protein
MRRWIAVGLVSLIVPALFAGNALAVECQHASGTYSNNETEYLSYGMTNKSSWYGDKDYNASRWDQDGNPSYQHYQDVSVYGPNWSFTNSIDVYRQTRIQRGGYTTSDWAMWQYASGSC